jgi:hypothetical protein
MLRHHGEVDGRREVHRLARARDRVNARVLGVVPSVVPVDPESPVTVWTPLEPTPDVVGVEGSPVDVELASVSVSGARAAPSASRSWMHPPSRSEPEIK